MIPRDTDQAAHEAQVRAVRRLTPAARVELCARMSEDAREIARSGIRARHPEYGAEEVEFALLRLIYGDELFRRAWSAAPVLDP